MRRRRTPMDTTITECPDAGRRLVALLLAAAALGGCAGLPVDGGFPGVAAMAEERLGKAVHWKQGGPDDEAVESRIRDLLAGDLDADGAVQIALLNNPDLQAAYEDLGVSQADLVQAGLLRNPVFSARARFPNAPPSAAELEFGIVQNFLDLLMRPARLRLAEVQFEAARLEVSDRVLALAGRLRDAYYRHEAALQTAAVLREIAQAAQASLDLAEEMHRAGNLSDLALAHEQALYEQVRIELARSEAETRGAREDLNALMGLWGADTAWRSPGRLPEIPAVLPQLGELESRAVDQRLDLAARGKAWEAAAQALGITRDWRWIAMAEVGVSVERGTDRRRVLGPELSLELPLFDQGQARLLRGEAELRRAEQRLRALAVEIRSEVRMARDRLLSAQDLARHYQNVMIPLRERVVDLTQRYYNFMLVGAFDLLLVRQQEITTYRDYIAAVRDFWQAHAALERAVGGRLPVVPRIAPQTAPPGSDGSPTDIHEHGGH